ncbi:MAG TPA: hypothetical protein VF143_06375 [Candidatus Nanopelagicales bacterium]
MHRRGFLGRAIAVTAAAALAASGATAADAVPVGAAGKDPNPGNGNSEVRDTGSNYNKGKPRTLTVKAGQPVPGTQHSKNARVGDQRLWLALDDVKGLYVKTYTLRGVGEHIEVWVADQLTFPAGDCRNTVDDGALVRVTDDQVRSFVREFDQNMYPKESAAFSVAPARDGSRAVLDDILSDKTASGKKSEAKVPSSYYLGDGAKTVTLIDNVRDANYYAPKTPDGQTYIAGFFYSVFNEYVDRNVMTIDAYDWLHRTGATPPDDSGSKEYQDCAAAIGAAALGRSNPYLYEGTFAHEYQHLLEYYADTDEVSWVNEGLSDWAQTLTGYVDPNLDPEAKDADSHIACFQGFLLQSYGGPENSLTMWEDQGGPEVLCDYGAAYTVMEYLHGRFGGDAFMSALHKEPKDGLAGLQAVLDQFAPGTDAQDVLHDWLAMVALDKAIDGGAEGADATRFTAPTLTSRINWDTPQAFASPGAPPNGGDFVKLGGSGTLQFTGEATYPPAPVEWTAQDGRLYSGKGDNLDRAIVYSVSVPQADPVLRATLEWGTELGWDFGFVQVWDEGTSSWKSLADQQGNATSQTDPGAIPAVVKNLPGFTGPGVDGDQLSGAKQLTFDLSAYAGKTVDVAFRYITDPGVTGLGFWVDDVSVGGSTVTSGADLKGAKSLTQAHPVPVDGWTVQVVGYGATASSHQAVQLTKQADGTWTATLPVSALGTDGVIVTADDPGETAPAYPRYSLAYNGSPIGG